jgi:hypothetical protein
MEIKIEENGILIDKTYLDWREFKFICGALNSVLSSKKVYIFQNDNFTILKNDKYEVQMIISPYDKVQWEKAAILLKHIIKFPFIPIISPSLVVEVKSIEKNKDLYFWTCRGCSFKATPKHFGQDFLCPNCHEKGAVFGLLWKNNNEN